MKDFQARVYTDDPDAVAAAFNDRGVAMGFGVRLCLTSVMEAPGMLGDGALVSVNVSFAPDAEPVSAARYLYEQLSGDKNAMLMVYDEAACSAKDVEDLLQREAVR